MVGHHCTECKSKKIARHTKYTPDFKLANGTYVEVKGRFTPKDRKTVLAMKAEHPDVVIRMLFYIDNKLTKVSETRYSDWCTKNEIPWALKDIPKEWCNGRKRG